PKLAAAYGQASPTTPTAARSAPHRRPRDDEFLHPPTHPTPGTEPQSGPVTPRRRPTPNRRTTPLPHAATRQRPRRRPPRLRRSRRADMPARPPAPALHIDGDTLPTLRWAVAVPVREKRRNGTRPGPILAALDQAAAQAMTAARQDDLPAPAPDPHSTQWLTAGQVADRLNVSRRH